MRFYRPIAALSALLCLAPAVPAQVPDKQAVSLRQPADSTYPGGRVSIDYTLDRAADRVDIAVVSMKGTAVVKWVGLRSIEAAASPADRFVLSQEMLAAGNHVVPWDLHAGGYVVAGAPGAALAYSEGPPAPPGSYIVQVTALGQSSRQPFQVLAKPALGPALESDLTARFDLAMQIRGRAAAASAMVRQVREMRARVAKRLEADGTAALKVAGTALASRLTELEGGAGQDVSSSSGAWPLQEALGGLAREVEAGGRPTAAHSARYLELGNILQTRIVELNALITGSYLKFEQGEPALPGPSGAAFGGAAVEFDSKGVDFEPWVKAYVAALKQRWVIPPSAPGTKGRVVIGLTVRKSGVVSGVEIVGSSSVAGFDQSANAAVLAARPAPPLPDAFPDEACPMRVTFYFNELPPPRPAKK